MSYVNALHKHIGEHSYSCKETHIFMSLDVVHERNPEKTLGAFEVTEAPQGCVMWLPWVDNG